MRGLAVIAMGEHDARLADQVEDLHRGDPTQIAALDDLAARLPEMYPPVESVDRDQAA